MMKRHCILIVLIILGSALYSQIAPDWLWAKKAGGYGNDGSYGIATDNYGNSYVTGSFQNTITLGSITLTSNGNQDIFVAKLGVNGNFIWARQAGGPNDDRGYGIATDSTGNCYLTGFFSVTATFGTVTLSSAGIFISKLDSNGNWLWAKQAGGSNYEESYSISVDSSDNSYVTGHFRGTASFGSTILNSGGSYSDIFIAKLDSNGNFLWAKQAGGTDYNVGRGIDTDNNGNCYVTGDFMGIATFGTIMLNSGGGRDIFITKLDSNGNYLWAKKVDGTNGGRGDGVATDGSGNSYITGYFSNSATFGSTTLNSSGQEDIFIAKIDGYGNWLWAIQAGGIGEDIGSGISVDSSGNSYVTGKFEDTASFGVSSLTSNGWEDTFIAKLDTDGNYLWTNHGGGSGTDWGYGIATDNYGNSYVSGNFNGTTVFGPNSITSCGGADIFVAKVATDKPALCMNETSITFVNAYFGYYATHNLWLKNFGVEALMIDSLAIILTDSPFEVIGLNLPFEIAGGDSTAIQIRFTPVVAGAVSDSLIIYNNSINLPRAAIRLSGTGQYVPPLPPENVNLVMDGSNAIVSWDAVIETELLTPIVPDYYLVFFNGSSDPDGLFYFLASVSGLTYTHVTVGLHSPNMFYRVRAYKYYGRGVDDIALLGLVPSMREDEVLGKLEVRR